MAVAERRDGRKVRYFCPPPSSSCVCRPSKGQREPINLTISGVKVTSTAGWASVFRKLRLRGRARRDRAGLRAISAFASRPPAGPISVSLAIGRNLSLAWRSANQAKVPLSRHPSAPGLSLPGVRLIIPDHAPGFAVLRALSLCTCCRHCRLPATRRSSAWQTPCGTISLRKTSSLTASSSIISWRPTRSWYSAAATIRRGLCRCF
jgi:hypothetical protein